MLSPLRSSLVVELTSRPLDLYVPIGTWCKGEGLYIADLSVQIMYVNRTGLDSKFSMRGKLDT